MKATNEVPGRVGTAPGVAAKEDPVQQAQSTPWTTDDTVYGVDGDISVTPTHRGTVQLIAGNAGDDWGVDIDVHPDDAERLADLLRAAAARARELEWEALA